MTMDPTPDTKLEERGRTKEVGIMKVSLREQSEERIDNERPESYYFAKYSDIEKKQFEECCVTYNDIFSQLYIVDSQPWKCLDLNKYNAKVEIELNKQKEKKKKKNRPGKKKRDVKVACRQRKLERAKLKKLEEDEKKKQLKKQKYQKKSFGKYNNTKRKPNTLRGEGGGAKKRQPPQQSQQSKPKYRTE